MATIRRASEADAGAIHALVLDLAASIGMADKVASSVADIRDRGFGADPAFEALIAERGGAPVGLCLFFESFSTWDGRRGVYVQDIYEGMSVEGVPRGTIERLRVVALRYRAASIGS